MYEAHYLQYFSDEKIALDVAEAKDTGFDARKFTELFYIPGLLVGDAEVFFHCLSKQQEGFLWDVFQRSFQLYGEECPFAREEFSVTEYSCGEDVQLLVLELPKSRLEIGSFLQLVLVLDLEQEEVYVVSVDKGEGDRCWLSHYDVYEGTWTPEGLAPADMEQRLQRILALTLEGDTRAYRYIMKRCPLCGQVLKLGLTAEETQAYQQVCAGEEGLEAALPALNAFEREFLITGMCLDCQCTVFHKELPTDIRRWALAD